MIFRKTKSQNFLTSALESASRKSDSKIDLANLGCGDRWHPVWRNFDLAPSNPSVEVMNLLAEWDIPDHAFQVVYSSHVLEHLPRQKVPQFLKNCWRVLQPTGIIRLVVPDLESIARKYLASIEIAETKNIQALAEHEWMTLELLDQLVRTFSGGFIGRLWASRPLHARSLIAERFGREAQDWIEKFDMSFEAGHSPLQPDQVYECTEPVPFKEMEFRRSGEIHRWMYDRISLEKLLIAAGFSRISVKSATESAIEGFANYCLDTDESGNVRKPDSLFMEAIK
jgi:predicted SAM-dependent methyltransferase